MAEEGNGIALALLALVGFAAVEPWLGSYGFAVALPLRVALGQLAESPCSSRF
jgi:hypothetical protein